MNKSTFIPSLKHLAVYDEMKKTPESLVNAKNCVDTLGYYGAINFMITESKGNVPEDLAVIIADIATHMFKNPKIVFFTICYN